ncbi:very-long-chain 3-oxoacyl-CoA reductase 1-like [Hordeum vulgare subsp. vulgare]|uniref:B-keto acyl reductase n=1 Tax=Hordeum vulgare subsp. vulgare TaxID=112509 RepID=A0A8I7BK40_HORVV|nr:very-long-chain 3-oxoacyl-CoA reductase 1-like [Hordeum vulgare subsp. vulgare]
MAADLQTPAWFLWPAVLGALHVAALLSRLLAHLAHCLRRPRDFRRCYGAWAVVTGPTSGIGRSVALELAGRGLNLVLVGLDAADLREVSDTITSRHAVETRTVVFDLSLVSTPQGDEALRRLRDAVEGLDVGVLVNNAGVMRPGAAFLHEGDAEAYVRMIRVNLWAPTAMAAAVIPGMAARGRGAVVNVGSGSSEAVSSFPLHAVYSGTKRYLARLSRGLAAEYAGRGVDVQCQAPLFVATEMMAGFSGVWRNKALAPTADAYARAAVRWVGRGGPLCVPSLRHRLLWCLLAAVPGCVQDWVCLREGMRQRRSSPASACTPRASN